MALDPLASTSELEAWLGESVTGSKVARADALLAGASTLVRSETGRAWVGATGEPEEFEEHHDEIWDALRTVTLQVAARVWRNPRGTVQSTTGPFSDTYDVRVADGLYLTDAERAILGTAVDLAVGDVSLGLGTISTTRGTVETTRSVDDGIAASGDHWTTVPWP